MTYLLFFLLAGGGVATVLQLLFQWRAVAGPRLREADRPPPGPANRPFLSVHLPACSEPPALVIATIRSVLAQDFADYELLVIDNNTADGALWRPVAHYCRDQARVRFFRVARLGGYKAGALNWLRARVDPRTTHVLTLDADYRLRPGALREVARAIRTYPGAALLQYPQAYRNGADAPGLRAEFRSFFSGYLSAAALGGRVLGTGTLSCVRLAALDGVGGWPTDSITEDAALGLAFHRVDLATHYIDRRIGHGLMPTDPAGLRKQRHRWIFGNWQVLLRERRRLRWTDWVQLTAWSNFLAPVLLAQGLAAVLALAGLPGPGAIFWAAALAVHAVFLLGRGAVFVRALAAAGRPGWLMHLTQTWAGAFAWLPALWGRRRPFVVTPKSGEARPGWRQLDPRLALLHGGTALALAAAGAPVFAPAFLLLAGLHGYAQGSYLRSLRAAAAVPHHQQLFPKPSQSLAA